MSPVVYMDRLMEGVRAAVLGLVAGATVLWTPSELPRAATQSTLVALSLVAGPTWDDTVPAGPTLLLPQSVTLTLTGAAGQIAVEATGARWALTGSGNAETDRDALLALLNPSEGAATEGKRLYGTFGSVSTDQITITGDDVKALAGLAVSGPISLAIDTTEAAHVYQTDALVRVGIQAYSTTRYPRGGAHETLTTILAGLVRSSVVDQMGSYGLELASLPTPPADLTAMSGPRWESRAASNIDLRLPWLDAEALNQITGAVLNVTTKGAGADILTTAEAP